MCIDISFYQCTIVVYIYFFKTVANLIEIKSTRPIVIFFDNNNNYYNI